MIKPSNWSQTYGTIHSKSTFCEVTESYRSETLTLCASLPFWIIFDCGFATVLDYPTPNWMQLSLVSSLTYNVNVICTCIIMQILNNQTVHMQMTPVSIWREQRAWKKTDLLLYIVVWLEEVNDCPKGPWHCQMQWIRFTELCSRLFICSESTNSILFIIRESSVVLALQIFQVFTAYKYVS